MSTPGQTVAALCEAAQRIHARGHRLRELAEAEWQMLLCECGRTMGRGPVRDIEGELVAVSPRCESCRRMPSIPVTVRLDPMAALALALEAR